MQIAIYVRCTRREAKTSNIVERKKVLRKYCKRNGHHIVRIYSDNRWASIRPSRPGLNNLRSDLPLKLFEAVVVKNIRTLGLSQKERHKFLELLEKHKVKLIFADEVEFHESAMYQGWYFARRLANEQLSLKIRMGMRQAYLRKIQAARSAQQKIN